MEKVPCPECGKEYEKLGTHWIYSPDHRPDFTSKQEEIITGLLMGDGCLNRPGKNPRIQVGMISPNYLKYLDNIFGVLGTGVNLTMTAEENAKKCRDSGFSPNAKPENYSDLYSWRTRSHPELHNWNWYKTGKKVWPESIELTPTVLKHWFVGDGYWDNSGTQNHISIGMANEVENTEKVNRMFKNSGLPIPSNYNMSERKDGGIGCAACFSVEDSKTLWEYMGDFLPDFEYKFPKISKAVIENPPSLPLSDDILAY